LAGIDEASPWANLKARCLLGSKKFIEKIAPALKEKARLTEIPRKQRLVCRPALEHLLPDKTRTSTPERNKVIVTAHLEYGYSLSEIAKFLGLHYTTVSKILAKDI
jgi:putative transposase